MQTIAKRMNAKLILWSIVVALGGFLFGFDTAVISGAEQSIKTLWQLSDVLHGLAIGVALFVAEIVLFPPFNALTFLIALTAILLICAPYTFRTSRAIWINFFVHYDPKIRAEVLEKKKLRKS